MDKPSVPNHCSVCTTPIFGNFIGTGDGSMKDGGSFAHPECYLAMKAAQPPASCAAEEDSHMTALEFFGSMAISMAGLIGAMLLDNEALRGLCVFAAILAANYAGWRGNQ